MLAQLIGTHFLTLSCMKMELPDIPAEERTPLVESLLAIIRIQQDRIQQLEETVQHLRDEIAKLKGQKPRPDIKASLLEAIKPQHARAGRRQAAGLCETAENCGTAHSS